MTHTKTAIVALSLGLLAMVAGIFPSPALADSDNKGSSSPKVEVSITESGKVLVRGAKVTSVSGSTVNASVTSGTVVLNWTVTTNGDTTFYDAQGKKTATFGGIVTGDTISFAGSLTGAGSTMSVLASAVKDWSTVLGTSASGEVESVNTSLNSLVLEKKSKSTTVQLTSSTTITTNGTTTPLSSIVVGDHVKVTGTYNSDGTVITATSVLVTKKISSGDRRFSGFIKNWFKDKKSGDDDDD